MVTKVHERMPLDSYVYLIDNFIVSTSWHKLIGFLLDSGTPNLGLVIHKWSSHFHENVLCLSQGSGIIQFYVQG